MSPPRSIIGYARVSTEGQGTHGVSLDAQEAAIRARATAEGWHVADIIREVGSGASLDRRPGATEAIARCAAGEADALAVTHLDRITRSVIDGGRLFERVRREGWALVAFDLGIDTRTSSGELIANVMVSVAQWQRRQIGEKTKEALAEARAQGTRLGRPPVDSPEADHVRATIRRMRADGLSWARIADALNDEGVPTLRGGRQWWHSSARAAAGVP